MPGLHSYHMLKGFKVVSGRQAGIHAAAQETDFGTTDGLEFGVELGVLCEAQ